MILYSNSLYVHAVHSLLSVVLIHFLFTVLIRVFIINYVMHGRSIFFVLPGTITLIYDYVYDFILVF